MKKRRKVKEEKRETTNWGWSFGSVSSQGRRRGTCSGTIGWVRVGGPTWNTSLLPVCEGLQIEVLVDQVRESKREQENFEAEYHAAFMLVAVTALFSHCHLGCNSGLGTACYDWGFVGVPLGHDLLANKRENGGGKKKILKERRHENNEVSYLNSCCGFVCHDFRPLYFVAKWE